MRSRRGETSLRGTAAGDRSIGWGQTFTACPLSLSFRLGWGGAPFEDSLASANGCLPAISPRIEVTQRNRWTIRPHCGNTSPEHFTLPGAVLGGAAVPSEWLDGPTESRVRVPAPPAAVSTTRSADWQDGYVRSVRGRRSAPLGVGKVIGPGDGIGREMGFELEPASGRARLVRRGVVMGPGPSGADGR